MSKQGVCPMAFNRKVDFPCQEENCAWWITKGFIEASKSDGGMMTMHSPKGCCAIKAVAWMLKTK
jgi:hypothetical protein